MSLSLHEEIVARPYPKELRASITNDPSETLNANENDTSALANGPIRMDTLRHEVYIDGNRISLTPREYALLHCFLAHQGRLLSHGEILKEVWGQEHVEDTQYLRVYIGQLRNKLETKPGLGKLIVAKTGVGYRMDTSSFCL